MKSILILCIAFAIAFPTQGFLISSITNAVSSVQNTISNTIDSISTAVSVAQFAGQFLWDNAFGPSWEMFLSGGADFIDNYFGSILNSVGKKREIEVRLQFSLVQHVFQSVAGQLVNNFHTLFNQFVDEATGIFMNSIINLVFGVVTINDVFGQILQKFKSYISLAVQQATSSLSGALSSLGPEALQIVGGLQQQLAQAGVLFQNELNALSSFAINAVNGALAYLHNNFGDLILYFESTVNQLMSEATTILTGSIFGLLFGTTTIDGIINKLIAKVQQYVSQVVEYTFTYVSQHLTGLYTQYQPIINQALTFVQSLNIIPNIQSIPFVQQLFSQAGSLFQLINPEFISSFINSQLVNLLG